MKHARLFSRCSTASALAKISTFSSLIGQPSRLRSTKPSNFSTERIHHATSHHDHSQSHLLPRHQPQGPNRHCPPPRFSKRRETRRDSMPLGADPMCRSQPFLEYWLNQARSHDRQLRGGSLLGQSRYEALKALWEAEEHLQAFFETSPDYVKVAVWMHVDSEAFRFAPTLVGTDPDFVNVVSLPESDCHVKTTLSTPGRPKSSCPIGTDGESDLRTPVHGLRKKRMLPMQSARRKKRKPRTILVHVLHARQALAPGLHREEPRHDAFHSSGRQHRPQDSQWSARRSGIPCKTSRISPGNEGTLGAFNS